MTSARYSFHRVALIYKKGGELDIFILDSLKCETHLYVQAKFFENNQMTLYLEGQVFVKLLPITPK